MAEKSYVYQVWEIKHDQDHCRDDSAVDSTVAFTSKADAQEVCDQGNEPLVRNLLAVEQNSYDRQVNCRLDALAANEILRAGGSEQRLDVSPIPRNPPNRDSFLKRLSRLDGWLYVERIVVFHALQPEPEPEVCHFCAEPIEFSIQRDRSGWVRADNADHICDDGHSLHGPHSSWVNDSRSVAELRAARGLAPLD